MQSDSIIDHPGPFERNEYRLDPMTIADAESIFAIAEPNTFTYMIKTPEWSVDGFRNYVAERTAEGNLSWVLRKDGEALGCSSIYSISIANRHLEIGHTWLTRSARRTSANSVMKLLMLEFAFEEFRAVRVQLKCDARNDASRQALQRLGATYEGTLRNHMILPDGELRQTAFFSILPDEWPKIRERLHARINGG